MSYEHFQFNGQDFVIDRYLANACASFVYNIDKDWDTMILISGNRMVRSGKCLDKQVILLNDTKPLGAYKDGEQIKTVSYDFKTDKLIDTLSTIHSMGKRKVYEIELDDGSKVRATAEHRFFTIRNHKITEKELKDLKPGKVLLCLK